MSNKTNYRQMSTMERPSADDENVQTASVDETIVDETVVDEPEVRSGSVINCAKLNIRTAPATDAEIVKTINKGTTVTIIDEIGDFYQINEKEYCMKKYISVKE